mmetsp:Transcript_28573/g.67106  ORF Transcript_28573/g.67106 Transcript_28573/m.67106 type:complete len:273 (-) Transcript_28573:403-1221(-)|eukprot:CAMPEP_0172385082 /NCGR_PEP_ID=MMETSP1061-20121228/2752_1 /TAXON_ID=37318 /ORGANISM="Pseudo-nitzschia pungens, Strain cf. pungens" /LENGTH=272 /DNA_ID=CAMNT_0013113929 /DNA_START=339 /DNA_END=1154 /DNA_ORIENTATION=+
MTLSAYEQLRLERIKRNQERLRELGLDKNPLSTKKARPKKKKQAAKINRVGPGRERRSRRLASRGEKIRATGKDLDLDLAMLDYNVGDGKEQIHTDTEKENDCQYNHFAGKDTKRTKQRVSSSKRRSITVAIDEYRLSEKDRETLTGNADENFLGKFQEFLEFENKISQQNVRSVMRQARKLASGEGIRYESPRYGWDEGCYFQRGVKITPMSDFVELMIEGQNCEDMWGRDHGNGWLLSHPLKKLLLFQQFILNNPDFLSSELRLKDYCDW